MQLYRIYHVSQYMLKPGKSAEAVKFFKEKDLPFTKKLPGVKSVRAYGRQFGLGQTDYAIEVWTEIENYAAYDAWDKYIFEHADEMRAFGEEFDQYFESKGSRLMGDWPESSLEVQP